MAWPYKGRRVSSLVPWGGSEEPESVEVSQDVVYRRGDEDWEGDGVGGGAGVEGEGGGGKARMARPYTGRRVSSLVPWGGSEKPETV